jgi:class I lanthipeptide synthase
MMEVSAPAWVSPLSAGEAERARATALAVGRAIRDDTILCGRLAEPASANRSGPPAQDEFWQDHGLAAGYAGLALLSAYLDRAEPGWAPVGHRQLAGALADRGSLSRLGPSVHTGWGGIAVAAMSLARDRPRYPTLLDQADAALATSAGRLAERVSREPSPLPPPLIDLISGLAGAAVALIIRRGRSDVDGSLEAVAAALARLAGTVDGQPRLCSPPGWGALPDDGTGRPVLNLGVAHGLPGVLAALSLGHRLGLPGLPEAIERLGDLLAGASRYDQWGPVWPSAIPLDPAAAAPRPARMTWCYGVAGCARALWLAGQALERPDWTRMSVEAITGALARSRHGQRPTSPTFCHGHAGLVHIALRFAAESGDPDLGTAAAAEVTRLLDAYDPDSRFGYRRVDGRGRRHDSVALLDGAAGVALVLLAAGGGVEPAWDRVLLVS